MNGLFKVILRARVLGLVTIASMSFIVASISFDTDSSTIKIGNGANFVVATHIPNCTGKIIVEAGGFITGNTISFNDANFENSDYRARIVGNYIPDSDETIFLLGDGSLFTGLRGNVTQSLYIRGDNNRLEGDFDLTGDIVLFDSETSLTYAKLRPLGKNVQLGGSLLALETDLIFADGQQLTGSGTLIGNGHRCLLGSDDLRYTSSIIFRDGVTVDLHSTFFVSGILTFSGDYNVLRGNGNILDLGSTGSIIVAPGSSLYLDNVVIKNVGQKNVSCVDDSARIVFQNVTMVQNDDFLFEKGSFVVEGLLDLLGGYTFVYAPSVTSTIKRASVLYCEPNLTFSYAPRIPRQDLLAFADPSSVLYLNGATLFTTATGLSLTKGALHVRGISKLISHADSSGQNNGVLVGDNLVSQNDFICKILPGATLSLEQGQFVFQNVQDKMIQMDSSNAVLRIGRNTTFSLHQSLDLRSGTMKIATAASLKKSNASIGISGSIEFFD